MNSRQHRANENGYFIVEILVIVSVLAMIVLSGFPHWRQWLEYQELQANGHSLLRYLQQGRSEAQRFNRDLLLIQGDKQRDCWLYFARNATGLLKVPASSCSSSRQAGFLWLAGNRQSRQCHLNHGSQQN